MDTEEIIYIVIRKAIRRKKKKGVREREKSFDLKMKITITN